MLETIALYRELQGKYLRPHWRLVTLLGALIFVGTAVQLITPQIVRYFIDVASEKGELSSLYSAAVVFLGAGTAAELLKALSTYLGRDIAWRATNRLRSDLTLHVLRLDMGFHNSHTPGDLLERIDGDIERLANFFSQFFVQLLGAILLLAGLGAILLLAGLVAVTWFEDWRSGLAVAGFAAFFLVTRVRLLYFLMPYWRVESEARAQISGFLGERLSGIKDIQKSGAVSYTMARFYEVMRRRVFSWMKAGIVGRLAWGVTSAVNSTRFPIGLAVAAYLFQRGEITVGTA